MPSTAHSYPICFQKIFPNLLRNLLRDNGPAPVSSENRRTTLRLLDSPADGMLRSISEPVAWDTTPLETL